MMPYKFKYFFSGTGVAPEEEINKWLKENSGISIQNISGHYDQVYIFYKEICENE